MREGYESQVWPPLQEHPRHETSSSDASGDEEEEDTQRPVPSSSRPSHAGNLPMRHGLTFEEWKAKKATYQPPKRAHFSRRDDNNREVHARVAKVGIRKEAIPLQTRGRLRPAWDERFVLDEHTTDRPGSKVTVVRGKDSYEHTMLPTRRPTTAPSTVSSPIYTERHAIPTQSTQTNYIDSTTQATNTRGTSPLPSSRQSIDSFQAPRFSLRTTSPVVRRSTSRSTSPLYSPLRKGDTDRNGSKNGHARTSYDHNDQENHNHNHNHNQWDREDLRDHHHRVLQEQEQEFRARESAREAIQSIVQGTDRRPSPSPVVVWKENDQDTVVEYTHNGK